MYAQTITCMEAVGKHRVANYLAPDCAGVANYRVSLEHAPAAVAPGSPCRSWPFHPWSPGSVGEDGGGNGSGMHKLNSSIWPTIAIVAMSTGSGDQLLWQMWRDVTENGPELAKLGLAVLFGVSASDLGPEFDPWSGMEEPGVTKEQAPPRIMNLLMSFWEQPHWSYVSRAHTYPSTTAGMLSKSSDHVAITVQCPHS